MDRLAVLWKICKERAELDRQQGDEEGSLRAQLVMATCEDKLLQFGIDDPEAHLQMARNEGSNFGRKLRGS